MITLNNDTLILAPMADLSHAGLRMLIESYGGCDLYFTEMISAAWILNGGPHEHYYESSLPDPERVVFQLVGGEEQTLTDAAVYLVSRGARALDLNMGCSAPLILKKGGGCAWMRTPERAVDLAARVREALPPHVSLSVKLRLGEKEDCESLLNLAAGMEKAGVSFLTLHPKTRKEKQSRPPRWSHISLLKETLSIPVVGNGHVTDPASCFSRREKFNPDGIMIGRGAVRRPWIFQQIRREDEARGQGETAEPFRVSLKECTEEFNRLLAEHQPPEFHLSRLQRFYMYFHRNFRFGHHLYASAIYNASSAGEVRDLVRTYLETHPEEEFLSGPGT